MAVALTNFEAMCGFRPLCEILDHLVTYPEFGSIVGTLSPVEDSASHLKAIFSNFMHAPDEFVNRKLEQMVTRLSASGPVDGSVDALIIRLNNDFPGDRGALCPLILNYIKLKPGKYT